MRTKVQVIRICGMLMGGVLFAGGLAAGGGAAYGQPYQKARTEAMSAQKPHAWTDGRGTCLQHGQSPCYPPCEDQQKRGAEPTQPRGAVPGVSPGVFVAPPQSGVVEGPSRSFELPSISLCLPEFTFGLPRLRFHGTKNISRQARMITDSSSAPYMANPHYTTALAAQQAVRQGKSAEEEEGEGEERAAEEKQKRGSPAGPRPSNCGPPRCGTYGELEGRILQLENSLDQQMQVLRECIEQLKRLRAADGSKGVDPVPVPMPPPCVQGSGRSASGFPEVLGDGSSTPRMPETHVAPAMYPSAIPGSESMRVPPLRRLPLTSE